MNSYKVIKRDGSVVEFVPSKIHTAITKAYIATKGSDLSNSEEIKSAIDTLTKETVSSLCNRDTSRTTFHIEDIQDKVELALMRSGDYDVAKAYVIYREERNKGRLVDNLPPHAHIEYWVEDGKNVPFDIVRLDKYLRDACINIEEEIRYDLLLGSMVRDMYTGCTIEEVKKSAVLASRTLIERDPIYNTVTARLLLQDIRLEVLGTTDINTIQNEYVSYFSKYVAFGIEEGELDPELATYDLDRISEALVADRDLQFEYLGLQTLYDRYLIHRNGKRIELPQILFMRVAMGLSLNETNREEKAIEFYNLLSSFDFMNSTPTLFNSGTTHSQLSSCYLSTIEDSLEGIYDGLKDNALLSKYAGGLGNDWTPVRAMSSHIKGTNGKSQGVIPFMKVANDTLIACNQSGKRQGSGCAYLEVWHLDIEEFVELRKNTGDDRRRTHDMNIATWIPDLFMKRVMNNETWTLFTPSEVPDLHDLYGQAFEDRYNHYEELAKEGKIKLYRTIDAVQLWRKILGMLFETGHPWITFKDPCNIRSPQQHTGVVHSSNLCCIAKDQRVTTDIGMTTIDSLYKSQYAPRVAGRSQVDSQASPMLLPRPNAPMVRVETKEGYSHKVTPDHRIWVEGLGEVEAQHLKFGDQIELQRHSMYGKGDHPLLAMLAALLKTNGSIDEIARCSSVETHAVIKLEKGITDHLEHEVDLMLALVTNHLSEATIFEPFIDVKGDIIIQSDGLVDILNKLNHTANDIHKVPEFVFTGNKKTVEQYLRGIYLSLGIVELHRHTCSVTLTSDIEFLQDIQLLWLNMGIKSSIINRTKMSTLIDGNYTNQNYIATLEISGNMDCYTVEKVTGLAKARNELEYLEELIVPRHTGRNHTATFIGLTELPNEDAYCLTVDSDDHAWTVNGFITHNTEITLNTNEEEIAVCNLGSINLSNHIVNGKLDTNKIQRTVTTAIRMLDNVIDINYYPVEKARTSNMRHRPIGLGIMGFQDALHKLNISYADMKAVEFADTSMETIAYHAYYASSLLAEERGVYSSYSGSLWSQGILPLDSIELLKKERNGYLEVDTSSTLDWNKLRDRINQYGMRNSNCLAIAPTATIANITGVSASIEPTFQNLYVKSNLSGEFTVINKYLVKELKKLNLWDEAMISDIKFHDGILTNINRIPDNIKHLYTTAFEMDTKWIVEAASRRQKWIDQGQSLNIYMAGVSGKKMDDIYKLAWIRGLKTTYYLRALSASNAEKSTIHTGIHNKVSSSIESVAEPSTPMCKIEDPGCESCQ